MQGYHQILIDTERAEAEKLLASAGLSLPAGCEYGLGYYEDGVLAACGFLAGNVLCGFCVAPAARGSGVSTAILSRLVLHGKERGINHFFVFTKAQEAEKFAGAGFALIAQSRDAALLEQGRPDYGDWLAATRERVRDFVPQAGSPASGQDCGQNCGQDCGQANASQGADPHQKPGVLPALGAIVMNANPFIHAVPLFVAVKAYGITCKRVSLLCSIYLENAIYRGKDTSAQSLIPDSEKRYIVGNDQPRFFVPG